MTIRFRFAAAIGIFGFIPLWTASAEPSGVMSMHATPLSAWAPQQRFGASTARSSGSVSLMTPLMRKSSSAQHMYTGIGGSVGVFPIVNDIVQPSPSWTISGATDPLAVGDSALELYALTRRNGTKCGSVWSIGTYSTVNRSLIRTLDIPCPPGSWDEQFINAVAVDQQNYLYVAYAVRHHITVQGYGVFVFRPFSSGGAPPIFNISYGQSQWVGLAFDPSGDLYIARPHLNDIVVYSHPNSAPTLSRRIYGSPLSEPEGLTIASDGTVYVACTGRMHRLYVLAYKPGASGRSKPELRVGTTYEGGNPNAPLTMLAKYLLVGAYDPAAGDVILELKALNGVQQPVAVIKPHALSSAISIGL